MSSSRFKWRLCCRDKAKPLKEFTEQFTICSLQTPNRPEMFSCDCFNHLLQSSQARCQASSSAGLVALLDMIGTTTSPPANAKFARYAALLSILKVADTGGSFEPRQPIRPRTILSDWNCLRYQITTSTHLEKEPPSLLNLRQKHTCTFSEPLEHFEQQINKIKSPSLRW